MRKFLISILFISFCGGSSATFADPDLKVSFGYLTNKLGGEYLIGERAQSLINSTYEILN